MTGEILLQIVMAMIGALGFGLLFHISGSRLITIMLGAAVNWGVYLLAMQWYDNRVTAFFVSTLATAALAELLEMCIRDRRSVVRHDQFKTEIGRIAAKRLRDRAAAEQNQACLLYTSRCV